MEAAVASVATGVLKPVLEKLAALLTNEYKRFKSVRKEIKSLTHELAAMEAFLVRMSEDEDPNEQDKVWMNEMRELSYDLEDAIDDFMQSIGDKDEKPDGFIEKIKSSLGELGKMKARRRIGKEIQDLKKQIKEVGERNARYKGRQTFTSTKNETVDPRALAIFEDASNLVGIDGPKAEIIKLLTEGASTDNQPKLVSIVGTGGMGKTTLANQVYKDLNKKFKCRAFLSVARNPDMTNIMRIIHSQVSGGCFADTEAGSIQQVIININSFLAGKRYIVVIDDIWDVVTWGVIKRAFPVTSSGSIIITTTRKNDVAESCRSSFGGSIYVIRPLNTVCSRQLFHRRLFESKEDCPSHLEGISCQILEKCAGLPLAIIAISGLLANVNKERTADIWNEVKDSIGRALERNPTIEVMINILSLSYFDLPPHLKTCLLYLGIFPEDSVIEKMTLICKWIAEGFIHKEGRCTTYDLGEICINELVNRSLIQVVHTGLFGEVKSFRVHDIILDFIISKSIEENFVTLIGVPNITVGTQFKVRRLSLQLGNQGNSIIPAHMVLSHVRSLKVFVQSFEISSLDEFMRLRVLDFEGCSKLENHHLSNIGRLFQLRCLIVRKTEITELPEEIGHLRCLETLDIRDTKVRKLPAAIFNLGKLVRLLMSEFAKIPDGIAKMQALEALGCVAVSEQTFNLLQELGQLKNLRQLILRFDNPYDRHIRVQKVCMEAMASSLQHLSSQNLRTLLINGDGERYMQSSPLSIQSLEVHASLVPQFPNLLGSLVNIQRLCLNLKGVGQDDINIFGALPALVHLILRSTVNGYPKYCRRLSEDSTVRISGDVGFSCLRNFCYDAFRYPLHLMFEVGSMPKLDRLTMGFLFLTYDFDMEDGVFDFGIENLPKLMTLTCKIAVRLDDSIPIFEQAKAAAERTARAHPNNPTLSCDILNI
ncbi:hypothetical protein ACQJBY_056938 [Aegilops geniculata]